MSQRSYRILYIRKTQPTPSPPLSSFLANRSNIDAHENSSNWITLDATSPLRKNLIILKRKIEQRAELVFYWISQRVRDLLMPAGMQCHVFCSRGMPSLKLGNHPQMVPVIRVDSYGSDAPRSVDSVRSPPTRTYFTFPGRSYSFDTGRAAAENGLLPISYR